MPQPLHPRSLPRSTSRTHVPHRPTRHRPSQLTGDTIVTFDNMEVDLGTLMAIGLVTRDARRQVRTRSPRLRAAQEQPQQEQTDTDHLPPNEPLDERSEAVLTEAFAKAPTQAVGAATSFITNEGAITDEAVVQLATNMGVEPGEVRERINHVSAALSKEAIKLGSRAVQCSEETAIEAFAWARTNMASELKETALRHFSDGRADYSKFVGRLHRNA